MAFITEISSVANTINKLHIQHPLHYFYQQKLLRDKQEIIDELFFQYPIPLLKNIDHPAFITQWEKYVLYCLQKNTSFFEFFFTIMFRRMLKKPK